MIGAGITLAAGVAGLLFAWAEAARTKNLGWGWWPPDPIWVIIGLPSGALVAASLVTLL